MLNIFPGLLFLAPLTFTLLRIVAALYFALAARGHVKSRSLPMLSLGILEAIVGIALLVGVSVQVAAIVGAVLIGVWMARADIRPFPLTTLYILLAVTISLVFTGAGPLAFDLPL